jgi:hypothetical protein
MAPGLATVYGQKGSLTFDNDMVSITWTEDLANV